MAILNTSEQPTPVSNTNTAAPSSSGSGFIGSIVGAANSAIMQWMQFLMNSHAAAKQYKYSMDSWNKTNEYNSPAAQMQRLTDAGLNPNLAAGNASAGGNASPAPSMQAVTPNFSGTANDSIAMGQFFQNAVRNAQEVANLKKENEKKDAEISSINANTANTELLTKYQLFKYNNMLPIESKKLREELNNIVGRNILLSLQQDNQRIQNQMAVYQRDFTQPAEYELLGERIRNMKYQTDWLNPAQRQMFLANAFNARQSGQNKAAERKYIIPQRSNNIWSQTQKNLMETTKINADAFSQAVKNNFLLEYGIDNPGSVKLGPLPIGFTAKSLRSSFDKSLSKMKGTYDDSLFYYSF